jgi:hypothetical protein
MRALLYSFHISSDVSESVSIEIIYDVKDWDRIGRGHAFSFYVTCEELRFVLHEMQITSNGFHSIIAFERVWMTDRYVDKVEILHSNEIRNEATPHRWKYFLWNKTDYPEIDFANFSQIDKGCSLNGLVELQHGLQVRRKGESLRRESASSVEVLNRVRNSTTGEERNYEGSFKLWKSLKLELAKILRYSIVHRYLDGRVTESEAPMMSEEFAQALRKGSLVADVEAGVYHRP